MLFRGISTLKAHGQGSKWVQKTTMRRNRRQPERLELSGTLRQHKANVWVALDMSGSITDAEFTNALEQVTANCTCL